MALDTYALTTVQDVLDLLGVTTHPQPQVIEDLINTASEQIILETGREFKTLTTSVVRSFPIAWNGYVSFGGVEPRTITLVRANVEGSSPTTLAAADYQLVAAQFPAVGYSAMQLVSNYSIPTSPTTGYAEVTATWGLAAVPATVKYLCRWQVKQWVQRDLQARSDILASGDESPQTVRPSPQLDAGVRRALRFWRTHPVVA